jgi:hypothetical protein
MTSETRTSDVVSEVEARLAAIEGAGLDVLPRLNLPGSASRAHKLASVTIAATTNTGQYRDIDLARVDDRVVVSLAYRVRANDQIASRNEAMELEDAVRVALTDPSWHADWHVAYLSTDRRPGEKSAEWWLSDQTFRVTRDAQLGG